MKTISDRNRIMTGSGALVTALGIAALGFFAPAGTVQKAAAQDRVEEIVVTATKRGEETIQDIAMSIAALSGDTLNKMRVEESVDFTRSIAGLDAIDVGPGQRRFFVRGLNSEGASTVGLYFDNIALVGNGDDAGTFGGNQPDLDMFDIERVEVLRGPQGTLYGAGSVSGVIRVISKKPDASKYEGAVDLDVATIKDGEENFGARAMINVPVVKDLFAVRAVGYYDERGGYIDNIRLFKGDGCYGVDPTLPPAGVFPPFLPPFVAGQPIEQSEITLLSECDDGTSNFKDVNFERKSGARLFAQWTPSDRTTALAQFFYQDIETGGRNASRPIESNVPIAFTRLFTPAAGDFRSYTRSQEPYEEDLFILALDVEHAFDFANLTVAGSYMERDAEIRLDSSNPARFHRRSINEGFPPPFRTAIASPTDHVNLFQEQDTELFTLEARLASSWDKRVNFLAGVFYQDITRFVDSLGQVTDPNTGLPLPQSEIEALLTQQQRDFLDMQVWGDEPFSITNRIQENETQILAFFGETYIDITPKLELMGGLRWFRTERDQESEIVVPFLNSTILQGAQPGPEINEPTEENDVLFKGQVTYKFTDDHLAYFQVAQGYRPGGVNARIVSVIPADFDSDQTLNLELGAKTSWAEDRFTANAALFHVTWDNIQFTQDFTNQFQGLINCTQEDDPVEAKGFEFAGDAFLSRYFSAGINFTVLDAEWQVDPLACVDPALLDEGGTTINGQVVEGQAGDKLIGVPDYSGGAYVEFNWPDPPFNAVNGFLRGDIQFQGEVDRFDRREERNVPAPSYALINLNMGMNWERWQASIYARNIANETAWLSVSTGIQQPGRVTVAAPRTVGINISARFSR